MLALGIIYSVGLSIVGLDFALLIGMLAGVVSFVPYLGFIVGIVVAGIAAVMQFQEALPLAYVALVFMTGQMVEGMLLTPLLVGEKIGLHPVAVIFAVLAGGQLFGFFGVLLALPVAAVVMVLLRYTHGRYVESSLYAEKDKPPA
jgi:predicted PurR-regulated permease PerM